MEPEVVKRCSKCGLRKSATDFAKDRRGVHGLYSSCKPCNKERLRSYVVNKARKAEYDREYRQTLGLKKTANQLKVPVLALVEMYSTQGGLCAICSNPESAMSRGGKTMRLAVDHCHSTGKVRGFLCANCNRALGLFKDSVSRLSAAILYLSGTDT